MAIAVAGLVVLSLALIHPVVELLVVLVAPGLIAMLFAGGIRERFQHYLRTAALTSGLTGGTWLIATAEPGENVPALLIGALVSTLLLVGLAFAGGWLLAHLQGRRAAWH